MFRRLLLLLMLVPILELYLLVQIGRATSAPFVVGLVLATGLAGGLLIRRQGLRTIAAVQSELSQGRPPAAAIVDGLMIFLAALLLMMPGVVTDVLAVVLLIPPVRRWLRAALGAWLAARAVVQVRQYSAVGPVTTNSPDIIDAEFTRKSPDGPAAGRHLP